MAKKNFKDTVKGADRLFSVHDAHATHDVHDAHATHDVHDAHAIQDTHDVHATRTERLSMRIDTELKNYISNAAWQRRVSVTEYICTLVRADMNSQKTKERTQK